MKIPRLSVAAEKLYLRLRAVSLSRRCLYSATVSCGRLLSADIQDLRTIFALDGWKFNKNRGVAKVTRCKAIRHVKVRDGIETTIPDDLVGLP